MTNDAKIENNTIKMRWAKIPTFENKYHEATNDALVSFIDFIPANLFQQIKPFWHGYIDYEGKKNAVYKVEMIEFLLSLTYNINIDGTIYTKSIKEYPGSLVINKLLNLCKKSNLNDISEMSKKQRSLLIFSQIKKDLWELFVPSEIVPQITDKSASSEWTDVKANKYERLYSFDLTNGKLYYEEIRYFNNEKTITARLATLKEQDDIVKLFKLVIEYKKYGKYVEELMNKEFVSQWTNGYDETTYAPKGKRLVVDPKHEQQALRKEQIEGVMKNAVFEDKSNHKVNNGNNYTQNQRVVINISAEEELAREKEVKKINKSFSSFLSKTLEEKREEIEDSFNSVALITNENQSKTESVWDELKSLDSLEEFLNS